MSPNYCCSRDSSVGGVNRLPGGQLRNLCSITGRVKTFFFLLYTVQTGSGAHKASYAVGARQWRTQEFCSVGVQQIQLRTEDRENRDLEAVAP